MSMKVLERANKKAVRRLHSYLTLNLFLYELLQMQGFRTCEDIFNILQISQARRKVNPDVPPPKAKLMASYYEKLTTLFWVSENYLFHAFAWYKYYSLCKEYNARGMSAEMKQMQASAVLLAALCIPTIPEQSGVTTNQQHGITSTVEDDIVQQKMARMATLLGFHTRNPTRQALLAEIKSKNILAQVPQYLRDLYYLLEENSDPLIMVQQAQPLLEQLKKEVGNTTTTDEHNDDVHDTTLGRYVTPLANVLLLKLVVNLTNAYHTVSMDFLKKLTAGLDMSFEQVEKSIVLFTQSKTLSVRVDHRAGCLRFGNTQLESDAMRSQLTVLAKQLQAVSTHVLVIPQAISKAEQEAIQAAVKAEEERHHAVYASVRAQLPAEHENVLRRKFLIEQRKERDELEAQNKIREEQRIKAEEEAARKKEDEARISREKRLREQEKQRKIQQEMENREKIRFLAAMNKNTEDFSEEQLAAIDTEALQREHQEKINKKKEEAERKTREAAKKLDYLVRAIRIEELPVIKQKYEDKIKKDRERYEQETIEKVKMAKVQWEADVTDKAILEEHGVFECMAEFEAVVMKGRKVQYDDICAQANRDAEVEAERAKLHRARKRKEDEAKRIADEEKRRKEEEANQKLEEQNRLKEKARLEKEAKEEEHRQAEVRRMDEERRKKEAAEPPAPRGSVGGGSGGGNSRYVPPSKRGGAGDSGGGGGGGGDRARPRFGGSEYPGGGRYQGGGGGGKLCFEVRSIMF
jgi:translation initiation factor 3 subunit A